VKKSGEWAGHNLLPNILVHDNAPPLAPKKVREKVKRRLLHLTEAEILDIRTRYEIQGERPMSIHKSYPDITRDYLQKVLDYAMRRDVFPKR
jgi:hypothetical protein